MALTLRAAITVTQTTFDVLGSDDLQPGDFKTIDSETIVIRTAKAATLAYGESARYRVSVYRGSNGTRAASHAASATLAAFSSGGGGGSISATDGTTTVENVTTLSLPPGSLSEVSPGVAGVAQVTTIQEAVIAFDASGIGSGNGHQVDITIPAGSYFRVEAIFTAIWDQPGGFYIRAGDAAGAQLVGLAQYDPTNEGALPTTYAARSGLPNATVAAAAFAYLPATGYAIQECVVFVKFSEDDQLATAGSARIVAMIWTPA